MNDSSGGVVEIVVMDDSEDDDVDIDVVDDIADVVTFVTVIAWGCGCGFNGKRGWSLLLLLVVVSLIIRS